MSRSDLRVRIIDSSVRLVADVSLYLSLFLHDESQTPSDEFDLLAFLKYIVIVLFLFFLTFLYQSCYYQ